MSLKNIEILSLNPHCFKRLIKCFLSGYEKDCELEILYMVLPIILHLETRKKLFKANRSSSLNSFFNESVRLNDSTKVSGRTMLSGFMSRYNYLHSTIKKVIIILYNENEIKIDGNKVSLCIPYNYRKDKTSYLYYMKASYNLGVIFSKADKTKIMYFLGVE